MTPAGVALIVIGIATLIVFRKTLFARYPEKALEGTAQRPAQPAGTAARSGRPAGTRNGDSTTRGVPGKSAPTRGGAHQPVHALRPATPGAGRAGRAGGVPGLQVGSAMGPFTPTGGMTGSAASVGGTTRPITPRGPVRYDRPALPVSGVPGGVYHSQAAENGTRRLWPLSTPADQPALPGDDPRTGDFRTDDGWELSNAFPAVHDTDGSGGFPAVDARGNRRFEQGRADITPPPVRRTRPERRYGDRVDGWVRPEYRDEPPTGQYWTPPTAAYGWPEPVERLPQVPSAPDPADFAEPTAAFSTAPPPPAATPDQRGGEAFGGRDHRAGDEVEDRSQLTWPPLPAQPIAPAEPPTSRKVPPLTSGLPDVTCEEFYFTSGAANRRGRPDAEAPANGSSAARFAGREESVEGPFWTVPDLPDAELPDLSWAPNRRRPIAQQRAPQGGSPAQHHVGGEQHEPQQQQRPAQAPMQQRAPQAGGFPQVGGPPPVEGLPPAEGLPPVGGPPPQDRPRPRPRPRPGAEATVYVSRHAADPT